MYFVEESKKLSFFKHFDYWLFITVIVLSCIGLLVVRSATLTGVESGLRIMTVQIVSFLLGVVLCLIISRIDYKDIKTLGIFIYVVSIVLLLLVLIIGTGDQWGSRSWIKFMSFSFQPSEIAKIAFIVVAAAFLEKLREEPGNRKAAIFKLVLSITLPVGLIAAERDFGTVVVFSCIFLVMLFVYGVKYKYFFMGLGSFLATAPFIWFWVLNNARRNRILVFLNLKNDALGAGYNVSRSKMAIGSGQLWGKGLFHGIQTQNSIVPVKESDFIFSVIGEELGFIGAIIVAMLVFFLLFRCIKIAKNSRDSLGTFLVVGITGMFAANFIENIGMTIGILPVTGVPLPFVSAGGSAMVTNFIALGIVLSVSIGQKQRLFNV